MDEEKRFFSFNKEVDYRRGITLNVGFNNDRLTVGEQIGRRAVYISEAIDSGEINTIWHRLTLRCQIPSGAGVNVSFYASNQPQARLSDQQIWNLLKIKRELKDESRIIELMSNLWQEEVRNSLDVFLHQYRGRYMWIKVEIFGIPGGYPEIERIRLYYPANTFVRYLPEIYQDPDPVNSFLIRFVGIFQSLYLDMEEQIERVTAHLDPKSAQPELLAWLAQWLKIEDAYLWPEGTLRRILAQSVELYKKRGTRGYMEDLIALYSGEAPYIVEYHHTLPYRRAPQQGEILDKLYGDNPYTFSVIVKEEQVKDQKDYIAVRKIIDNSKPAYTEARLIVLRPYICLDQHTYLGINSGFIDYADLRLNDYTELTMVRLS